MCQVRPRWKQSKKGLHQFLPTIDLREHNMFCNVRDDIEAIQSNFLINQVNKKWNNKVHKFKAFDNMVFIGSDESKIPNDEDNHSEMFDKF